MKKLLLTVVSFSVAVFAQAQSGMIQQTETFNKKAAQLMSIQQKGDFKALAQALPTGVLHLEYDTAAAAYDTVGRTLMSDYQDGMSTLSIEQTFDGSNFKNSMKMKLFALIDTTAQKFELDSMHMYMWDTTNNVWLHAMRMIVKMKAQNKFESMTSYLNLAALGVPLGWKLWGQETYYYDSNEFLIASGSKAADPNLGFALMPDDSTEFSNDANGNPLTEIGWIYDEDKMMRVKDSKYIRTFDANDNAATEIYQWWDTTGSAWVNSNLDSMSYDANDNISSNIQCYWDDQNSKWEYSNKWTFTYNASENLTAEINHAFNPLSSEWRASYKKAYTYNVDGSPNDEVVWRSDDGTTWYLAHEDSKDLYLYDIGLNIPANMMADGISLFPNPSNGMVNISLGKNITGNTVFVTVFNVTGQVVYYNNISSISGSVVVANFSELPAGTYLLEVANGNNVAVKRMVITE